MNTHARTQTQSICAFVVSSNRRLLRSVPISMSLYLHNSLSIFFLVLLVIPFVLHAHTVLVACLPHTHRFLLYTKLHTKYSILFIVQYIPHDFFTLSQHTVPKRKKKKKNTPEKLNKPNKKFYRKANRK